MSNELTEAETDMLEAAYDFDFDSMVKVVGAIVAAREAAARREALLEAAEVLGQLGYTGGNVDFADGREFEAGRIAGWLLERVDALAEPERDEEGGR